MKLICVYCVSLCQILKKHEYFGKYGKIHKVVINPSTTYAGVQGPSASAYVTYCSNNDALRAIQSVNNIMIDGRLIKTSLGTTKYCSHFMKNQQCPKPDCMYLHELGDLEASFTKEEMHQGKHQEYEKRLHDALIAQTALANSTTNATNTTTSNSPNGKLNESNKQTTDSTNGPEKSKEAWPSLSISPTNKEAGKPGKGSNNKENGKKSKADKTKNKKSSANSTSSNSSNGTNANSTSSIGSNKDSSTTSVNGKDSVFNITKDSTSGEPSKPTMSADEELNLLSEIENDVSSNDLDGKADTPSLRYVSRRIQCIQNTIFGSSHCITRFCICYFSLSTSGDSGTISDSVSGKSSPANFSDHVTDNNHSQQDVDKQQNQANLEKNSFEDFSTAVSNADININLHPLTSNVSSKVIDTASRFSKLGLFDDNNSFFSSNTFQPSPFFKLDAAAQLRNLDQTSSPQLPDLLSGTESDKERQDLHEKLNLLKGLSDFGSNSMQNGFGATSGLDELHKRRNVNNGLGLHSNGLIGKCPAVAVPISSQIIDKRTFSFAEDNALDFFGGASDHSRFSQLAQNIPNQRLPLQNNLHQADGLGHQVYTNNLSKFFDFHKNQQQQQQQQQFPPQQQLFMSDPMNGLNLVDQSRLMDARRLNSQFMDQPNPSNGKKSNKKEIHLLYALYL